MFMVFVYMPDRQEALLFGGSDASHTSVEETWVWSAGCWAQQAPANSPPGRDFAAAAYDLVNHEVLVYGGRGNGQFYSDTWAWNGKSWTQVAAVGPPDLLPSAVAGFDPVTQRVLLFGAARDGSAQTWTWDGLRWQQLSPTRTPEGREAPSLVVDPSRGQLMLFGGRSVSRGVVNDTWTWDGRNWNLLKPATSPPPRFRAAMGSLAAGRVVILWGGVVGPGVGDAWKWDGTNWSQIASPGVRYDAAAIDVGPRVIFFGGDSPTGTESNMLAFDGASWTTQS
jgi:hypothetical protein